MFTSDIERKVYIKMVKDEKGEGYSNYIEQLAEKMGFSPIRAYYIKQMNKSIQSEVFSSMQSVVAAGAANSYSKRLDPAIVGGIVSSMVGEVAGIASAYYTALKNKDNNAEFQRDLYLSKNAIDLSFASFSVDQVELFDYRLIMLNITGIYQIT